MNKWLALSPHARRSWVQFPAEAEPCCVEFACPSLVRVGFPWLLQFPPLSETCMLDLSPVSTLGWGTG